MPWLGLIQVAPCRLDLQHRHCSNVMQPYTKQEAQSAFHRLLKHHQANGWDATPPSHSQPGHHAPAVSRWSQPWHSTSALTDDAGPRQPITLGAGQFMPQALTDAGQSSQLASDGTSLFNPRHAIRLNNQKKVPSFSGRGSMLNTTEAHADAAPHPNPQQATPNATAGATGPSQGCNDGHLKHFPSSLLVDLTDSPGYSNRVLHEGVKGTRHKSSSPSGIRAMGTSLQPEGDQATRNSLSPPVELKEDPEDTAEPGVVTVAGEVVHLMNPKRVDIQEDAHAHHSPVSLHHHA